MHIEAELVVYTLKLKANHLRHYQSFMYMSMNDSYKTPGHVSKPLL